MTYFPTSVFFSIMVLKEENYVLEDLGPTGSIILKWISKHWNSRPRNESLIRRQRNGSYDQGNHPQDP